MSELVEQQQTFEWHHERIQRIEVQSNMALAEVLWQAKSELSKADYKRLYESFGYGTQYSNCLVRFWETVQRFNFEPAGSKISEWQLRPFVSPKDDQKDLVYSRIEQDGLPNTSTALQPMIDEVLEPPADVAADSPATDQAATQESTETQPSVRVRKPPQASKKTDKPDEQPATNDTPAADTSSEMPAEPHQSEEPEQPWTPARFVKSSGLDRRTAAQAEGIPEPSIRPVFADAFADWISVRVTARKGRDNTISNNVVVTDIDVLAQLEHDDAMEFSLRPTAGSGSD